MTNIELIKSKLDIVDVVASYIPELKRAGANYKARCPFHNEKSASFMVNPSLQIYKCFGCGKGGDVINFIQEIERLDFPEALKLSAEKAHVELSENYSSEKSKKEQEEKKQIIEANTIAAKFYHYILITHETGKKGREYAQKRGIDGERLKSFMMGYAPNSKDNLKKFLLKKGFDEESLIRWGLLIERSDNLSKKRVVIDKFRHRLMHPIFNLKGEVIGFSGRYIGTSKEAPKYLNSPETLVYKKNENLYGLYQAKESMRKENFVIVEEGNIDILSSHRVGIENIVAPLGTAFTENQAKLLKRFVDEFYFCFDTDTAGLNALIKSIAIVESLGVKHRVININPYKDPDELIMSEPEEWKSKVKNSVNTFEYLISIFSKGVDLNTVDGKLKFSSKIIPVLRLIKDEISLSHFMKTVSIMLEITENILLSKVRGSKSVNQGSRYEKGGGRRLESGVSKQESGKRNQRMENGPELRVSSLELKTKDNEYKLESYFLSLIVVSDSLKRLKISPDMFYQESLKVIYEKLIESSSDDPASIYDSLSDIEKEYFEEIMMFDGSLISDLKKEVKNMERVIRERYLKREIMKLRKEMVGNENSELVVKLQALVNELGKLRKSV